VDHVNRIRTDNRVANLRWVTAAESTLNRELQVRGASRYRGVSREGNRWRATYAGGRIGAFGTEREAAAAYNARALEAHAEAFQNEISDDDA
jgi:hypothetical protein